LRAWQNHQPGWAAEAPNVHATIANNSTQYPVDAVDKENNQPANVGREFAAEQPLFPPSNLGGLRKLGRVFADRRIAWAIERGLQYLAAAQRSDGSWIPLWFGNQYHPAEENPVYGTGRVLLCYRDLDLLDCPQARRGAAFLAASRRPDGGWGTVGAADGVSSVEETAIAVEALLGYHQRAELQEAVSSGINWLIAAVKEGRHRRPAPIGLYFAKLWYHEALYPLVFTVAALGHAVRVQAAASAISLDA